MGVYAYKGQLTNRKPKSGLIAAKNVKDAKMQLETMAVRNPHLHLLGSMGGAEYKLFPAEKVKKLKKKDMAYLFTQMCFLLKAGVTTYEAIEVLSTGANIKIACVCVTLKQKIIDGVSLADALEQTKLFPADIVEKVRAGESSNSMIETLENIAQKLKEEIELVSNIKGGMAYPVFSLVAVLGIAMFMLIVMIPQIANIVKDFGAELPAITKMLISISDWFRARWLYLLGAVTVIVLVHIQMMKRNRAYKKKVNEYMYKMPVFGSIIKKVNLLYFSSVISQLLSNGKNTAESLGIAKKTIKNTFLYDEVAKIESDIIRKGEDLYTAMAKHEVFPNEYLQMISIGMRTGDVSGVLDSVYTQYRYEVKDEIKAATDMIQPISMIIIGVIVAVFVLGMYSAIYCIF